MSETFELWTKDKNIRPRFLRIIKGLDSAKLIKNFNINSILQGKNIGRLKFKMKRELFKNCQARYYFLINRVAPILNSLPYYVVNAKTINGL